MPVALPHSRPKRSPRRSSYTPLQKDKRQRSSVLENKYWRPFRNSAQLALQVYELTHPEGVSTFEDLERETDANKLELYRAVALRLSEMLVEDPANAEKLIESVILPKG